MSHRIPPEADEEFAQAVRHYSEIDPELGIRFYREMERLIRDVCTSPGRFFMFFNGFRRLEKRLKPLPCDPADDTWLKPGANERRYASALVDRPVFFPQKSS